MRHWKPVIPFFLATALAVGCQSKTEKSAAESKQHEIAALQLEKAKAASTEATQAMEDYAYARKAEFVAKMNKDLVASQGELDRLGARIESSGSAAKDNAKANLQAAREKWAKTRQQLDQAENAGESTWNDVKRSFKDSYAGLTASINDTRQWLSDKIAP